MAIYEGKSTIYPYIINMVEQVKCGSLNCKVNVGIKALMKGNESMIDQIKNYFHDRGIIRGTQEIIETTVAVATVVTVGYAVAKNAYGHFITRHAVSREPQAPIDIARRHGSAEEMLRKNKQAKKAIDREMAMIEKEAINRLSSGRNDIFKDLSYTDRREILEGDGVDVEGMERQIQTEIRVNKEIKKIQEAREKKASSFFNRVRNCIPMFRDTESNYTIPRDLMVEDAKKTGATDLLTYDYINKVARERALKKLGPHALDHPDRFIVKPDGRIIPDTYEFKKARMEEVDKLLDGKHVLPRIPNPYNQLDNYGPKVKEAYLDMRKQLSRVTHIRRSAFDKMIHTGTPQERYQQMEDAWQDAAKRMDEPQTPWYGDTNRSKQYRTTASADSGTAFSKELDDIITLMDKLGVGADATLKDSDEMDNLIKVMNGFTVPDEGEVIEDAAWAERLNTMLKNANGGVHPKDVPFFDEDFYDGDIDTLVEQPHRPLVKIHHKPLTVEKARADAKAAVENKHWSAGPKFKTDFDKTPYRPLQKYFRDTGTSWRKRKRTESKQLQLKNTWRTLHPFGSTQDIMKPVGFLERMENDMAKQSDLRDKDHLSILRDKDFEDMMTPSKKKNKRKNEFFSEFDFNPPKKGKKKKKKAKGKKKDKDKKGKKSKKKEKAESFLSGTYDDALPKDITNAILGGVSKRTAKEFSKSMKFTKAGVFH